MKICSQCNNEIPDGAKWCGFCGEKFVEEKLVCPKCGIEFESNCKFCDQCGTMLRSATDNADTSENSNFTFTVKTVLFIEKMGTVIMGTVEDGTIKVNDTFCISSNASYRDKIIGLEINGSPVASAQKGQNVAIITNSPKNLFKEGDRLQTINSNVNFVNSTISKTATDVGHSENVAVPVRKNTSSVPNTIPEVRFKIRKRIFLICIDILIAFVIIITAMGNVRVHETRYHFGDDSSVDITYNNYDDEAGRDQVIAVASIIIAFNIFVLAKVNGKKAYWLHTCGMIATIVWSYLAVMFGLTHPRDEEFSFVHAIILILYLISILCSIFAKKRNIKTNLKY